MTIDHRRGWLARLITAAGLAALAVLAAGQPAGAHPFGPPLAARVDVDGNEVTVTWTAAEDDWVNLGEHLDAFTTQTDATGAQLTGAELLERSDNLPSYLLSHIGVAQDGQACEGRVEQLRDLLALGALLVFECPAPVSVIDLSVTALIDVNENYRTVVTSDVPSQPAQSLFTSTTPTQQWRFDAAASTGTATIALAAAGVLVVGAVGGGLFLWRRTGASRPEQAGSSEPVEVAR